MTSFNKRGTFFDFLYHPSQSRKLSIGPNIAKILFLYIIAKSAHLYRNILKYMEILRKGYFTANTLMRVIRWTLFRALFQPEFRHFWSLLSMDDLVWSIIFNLSDFEAS